MEFDRFNVSNAASWQLGWYEGEDFIMTPNAEETLENLLIDASKEGGSCRLNRANFLRKDFIPFFIRTEEDPKVFTLCSKLLLLMTQPLECFSSGSNAEHITKIMLMNAKEAIRDNPDVIKSMFREINSIIDFCDNFSPSKEDVDTINNCLLILRNLFHISDESKKEVQEDVFKTIFNAGFPALYKRLVSIDKCRHWTVSIVQLLSLMYKDVTSVSLMLELTFREDADGSEKTQFDNYTQEATRGNVSDRGAAIVEQEEEDESDDDSTAADIHNTSRRMEEQFPGSPPSEFSDEMDLIQVDDKVLQRLSGTGKDDREINRILAHFGVTVLKNGFKDLVANLLTYLTDSSNSGNPLDQSYLTWLLSYFLKFVFLPEMSYDLVDDAISLEVVNFLTYLAVNSVEVLTSQLLDAKKKNQTDVDPTALRRVHLCVMAMREVFHSLNYISTCMKLTSADALKLQDNFFKIASLQDLQQIFILMLRTCPLETKYRIYLRDIVTTNHVYLLLVEIILGASSDSPQIEKFRSKFSMLDHVSHFAQDSIVRAYGYLLENYEQNSPCLNDCIMTMLHHISGDCGRPEVLLQIPILSTFMEIYENEFPLGRESMELVEYILCKFESSCKEEESQTNKEQNSTVVKADPNQGTCSSSSEERENDSGVNVDIEDENSASESPVSSSSSMEMDANTPNLQADSDCKVNYPFLNQLLMNVSESHVATLKRVSPSCRKGLDWVSGRLLESCFVLLKKTKNTDLDHLEEPIPFYFHHFGLSTPIVPFLVEENEFLSDPLFINLLTQLGFYLHEGPGACFPRIPSIWGPQKMYRMATFLSSLKPKKFSEEDIESTERLGERRLIGF